MEPSEADGSPAPQAASPGSASADPADSDQSADATTPLPAESVVLIESLTGSAAGRHATAAAQATARRVSGMARGVGTIARRHKLEIVAVLLLGVGGAVWPPVWVLGVFVALPSKVWDLRDKWTGLVAPVLVVIASTVLIVVVGGRHGSLGSYAFEAWLGAGRVFRVTAALGAGYLLWRLHRGRREPKQPPWNVPHRLG